MDWSDRRGYLLVEIVLASVIAFGIAYFIITMTIDIKNKNEDLIVETTVNTDKTIIMNKLMKLAKEEKENFDCAKLSANNQSLKYDTETVDFVSTYATVGDISCTNTDGNIKVEIPLEVKQMGDVSFTVNFKYRY